MFKMSGNFGPINVSLLNVFFLTFFLPYISIYHHLYIDGNMKNFMPLYICFNS